jgi:hypothetical protein
VVPVGYNFTPNPITQSRFNRITVNVYCIDLILNDRANIPAILNTTSSILNDLFKWLTEGYIDGVDVVNASQLKPLNNYTMESCAGWMMTLTVDLDSYSLCDIPWIAGAPVLGPTGGSGGTGPGPGPTGPTGPIDPGGSNWRLNYSVISGTTTPVQNPPVFPADCVWSPLNGLANNNVAFQIGAWQTIIPFQIENEVRYFGSIQRNFNVTASVSASLPTPGIIEWGFRYSQGFTGSMGQYTSVLGTGTVVTGGVAHAPVTLTTTWSPSIEGDKLGLAVRFCGTTPQVITNGTGINVTIQQIP